MVHVAMGDQRPTYLQRMQVGGDHNMINVAMRDYNTVHIAMGDHNMVHVATGDQRPTYLQCHASAIWSMLQWMITDPCFCNAMQVGGDRNMVHAAMDDRNITGGA